MTSPNQLKAGDKRIVEDDWFGTQEEDDEDFERDTRQFLGVTGRRDDHPLLEEYEKGDQSPDQITPGKSKDDCRSRLRKKEDIRKLEPPQGTQEDPSPQTWSGHPDNLTPGSQDMVEEGRDDSSTPRSSLKDDICVPLNIEGPTTHSESVLVLNHSHHDAHFVESGGVDTWESVDDTRRKENDGLLDTATQRKDGEDQAPVLSVELSVVVNVAITPVAPSSGIEREEHTGKDKTIHLIILNVQEYLMVPGRTR